MYGHPPISSKFTPLDVAMKLRVMKLIDLVGLIKILATNSFLSMTLEVLLLSSQITLKSSIPRRA